MVSARFGDHVGDDYCDSAASPTARCLPNIDLPVIAVHHVVDPTSMGNE